MTQTTVSCVLLADRHPGVTEGVRGLLGTQFEMVTMVADLPSLLESAERLQPNLAVADFSLTRDDCPIESELGFEMSIVFSKILNNHSRRCGFWHANRQESDRHDPH